MSVRSRFLAPLVLLAGVVVGPPAPLAPPCPNPMSVSVTPDGSSVSRAQYTNGHTATFTVQNTGSCTDVYLFSYTATGPISGVSLNKSSASVTVGNSTTVIATYNVGASGSGVLTLTANGQTIGSTGYASDNGSFNVTVIATPVPLVFLDPHNYAHQDLGRCAVGCFAATHGQSTVPYFSLDAARNVTLVYNGDRVDPKPFLHVNVRHGGGPGDLPSAYRLQLKKADQTLVTFLNTESTLRFQPSVDSLRLGGQLDAGANGFGSTGVYPVTVIVGAQYVSGVEEVQIATKLVVVNETNSSIARGWTVAGIQRLYTQGDGSALVTDGTGSAVYFAKSGSVWTTPAGEFSRLTAGGMWDGSGWTRAYPDSTKVIFDAGGRVVEVRDRFNNTGTVSYDGSGRVWQLKDPLNLAITLAYDASGRLTSITDAGGRVTDVVVDASGRLTTITDPDGIGTIFGYDASLRLSTITDRRGNTATLAYDAQSGKLASVTAPAVQVVNTDGLLTTASPVTSFEPWQKKGVPYGLTNQTAALAPRADTVYARVTDPGGHTTRFTVNRWGTPAVATDALGRTDSIRFDGNGLAIRVRTAVGAVDSAVYNTSGLPTYVKASGPGAATQAQYGAWGLADSIWTEDGNSGLRNFIGPNGRVDSVRVAGGTLDVATTRYRYDARGRVDSVVDAALHLAQRTWYEGTNGNRSKDAVGGRETTYGYDPYGRMTTVSAPGLASSTTYYSIINRPDSVRDGVHPVPIRYGYDALLLTSVTDPKGQFYGFGHNALGWLIQRTDPAGRSDAYRYSRDGELRRWTNRRGQTITTVYDVLHRPTSKSGTDTTTETWAYPSDTVVVATSPVAVDTLLANRHGQLLRASTVMAGQVYTRRYTYTTAGALDTVLPTGAGIQFQVRQYVWNLRRGTLTDIKLGLAHTTIGHTPDGLPKTITLPGGDQVKVEHTPLHVWANLSTTAPYAGAVNRAAGLDSANRLWRQIETLTTGRQYTYDSLGRVTADSAIERPTPCDPHLPPPVIDEDGNASCTFDAEWAAIAGQAFSYDSAGNRRDWSGDYATGNRITAFAGCTYGTDFDGNVTSRTCGGQTTTFTWTAENRLASLTVNGQPTTFHYNAAGRLVRKATGGVVRHFLWERDNLLAELDAAGTGKIAEYSYYPGLDNLHALIVGNVTYYAHHDLLGNVIALTDATPALSRTYQYDTWGQYQTGLDYAGLAGRDRARFKGALWVGEDTELYYMRARWYEPHTGRFLSEDPIGLAGGLNPYLFAGDDPVNSRDPSGMYIHLIDLPPVVIRGRRGNCGDFWYRVYNWEECSGVWPDDPGGPGGGWPGQDPSGDRGGGPAGPGPLVATPTPCRLFGGGVFPLVRFDISSGVGVFPERLRGVHHGVDFLAPRGTPVLAFAPGVVERVSYDPGGYGHQVVVRHTNADGGVYWTQYAHLVFPNVLEGQVLAGGAMLGRVGRSGITSASIPTHLHFEIRTAYPARRGVGGLQNRLDPLAFGCGGI